MPSFGCERWKPSVGKAGPPLAQTGGLKDAATPSAQLRIAAGGAGSRPACLVLGERDNHYTTETSPPCGKHSVT